MKRYDALLDEDPIGGWVNYEEYVQEKIELESNNITLSNLLNFQDKESLRNAKTIESLRGSVTGLHKELQIRMTNCSQLRLDFETEQVRSGILLQRIQRLNTTVGISLLVNITIIFTYFLNELGAYIGKIN
jgi:hypothetical protein